MARTRGRPRSFQNRSRPNRSWAGVSSTAFTTVAANSAVLVGSFVLNNTGIDETILRTVGTLAIRSDQLSATENQIGAMGIALVTDAAHAAGVASLPDPITEIADDGWLLYVPFVNNFTFITAAGFDNNIMRLDFDSKAKRVVSEGQRAAIVIANGDAANGFQFALVMRLLSQVRGTS